MTETAVGKPGRRARAPRAPEPQRASVVAFGLVAILVIATGAALGPPAGVAAVAAVGFGIIVLRRPVVGGYVLAACVAPMSGLHRGLPVPGFRLTELLIVGVATIVLVTARTTPRWSTFDWLAFGYVIANGMLVWVNVVRTEGSFSGDTFGTLIGPLQYFLLYRTLMTAITTREERARALSLVLLSSIPVAILTLFQQWNIAGARSLLDTLTGPEGASAYANTLTDVARATGPFPHWHNLAGYLMLVLLLIVSLLHERTQLVMRNRNLALIFIPAVVALAQTASIAPMLGLIVGSILVATYVGQTRRLLMWLGDRVDRRHRRVLVRVRRPDPGAVPRDRDDGQSHLPSPDDRLSLGGLDDGSSSRSSGRTSSSATGRTSPRASSSATRNRCTSRSSCAGGSSCCSSISRSWRRSRSARGASHAHLTPRRAPSRAPCSPRSFSCW